MRYEKPAMIDVVPPGKLPGAEVVHFEITKEEAEFGNLRAAIHGMGRDTVRPGRYAKLLVGGRLMMSDTDMEWQTSRNFIWRAHGDVLVAGLGLGLVLVPVLAKPEVKSVLVIEKSQDVVDLVLPHLQKLPGAEKLAVVVADALEWRLPKGQIWDTIFFDIWPNVCEDNLVEMTRLKRRFARRLDREDPVAWMGCWREDDIRYRRAQERRMGW